MFEGRLVEQYKCNVCHQLEEPFYSDFIDLSLDMKTNAIGTIVDLKDCIQNYLKTDLVDSDYMCINPDCLSNERKIEVNIDEYPLVLVLHLKRFEVDFESNKVSKNMQQIKIDEELVFT